MARMSIDDMFLRDPRIVRLGRAIGTSKFDARGRLLEVIGVVYDRIDDVLTADDIDVAADLEGFAQHLVDVDLAVPVRGKYRIRGATERIEYLKSREESGRVGGIKSGESRRNKREAKTKVTFEANEAPLNPPDPVPDPVPDKPTAPVLKISASPPAREHPGSRECTNLFFSLYGAAYGAKPTWGGRQGASLNRLLKAHDLGEIQRRMRILFASPPSWLQPPYDFGTFVQHFDKLVVAAVSRQTSNGLQAVLEIARGES